jgi:hypothetical protein
VTPADFSENLERYSLSSNYIFFDNVNEDMSAADNPQGGGKLPFEAGLRLPIGQFAAVYPDVSAGLNTVIYIEEAQPGQRPLFQQAVANDDGGRLFAGQLGSLQKKDTKATTKNTRKSYLHSKTARSFRILYII